ncbi:MAG: preprotein translocase subunit Sec61beta [Candidatus Woesearchaeota archaeon]
MARDKVSMPSSMGGLVRYFDEYKSKIQFKPGHIIVLIIIVIIIEIVLHLYGKAWLGV